MIAPSALRAVGTWGEQPWQYPAGRVAPNAEAVKVFTWASKGISAVNGEELTLAYYTQNRVPIAKMEDLEFVALHEKQAILLLERLVALATQGVAYIPMLLPFRFLHAAVCGAVQAWINAGGYPDDWAEQMAKALTIGNAEYIKQMQWSRGLGAQQETDPVLQQFGWRIAITPLEIPLVVA